MNKSRKNHLKNLPRNGLIFLVMNLISICVYPQFVRDINHDKYSYDSALESYNYKNKITVSPHYYKNLQDKIDSIALHVLFLKPKDEIIVLEDIVKITKDKLIAFMTLEGHVKSEPVFQQAYRVTDTDYWIVRRDKWGLINPLADNIIQFNLKYNSLKTSGSMMYGDGNPNRYVVSINGLYGIVDSLERVIIPFDYQEIDTSNPDMYLARKENRYGFIDSLNNIIIPFDFQDCKHFYENDLAPAKREKWGLIDRKGNFVASPKYDDMHTFQKGILKIKEDGKVGFLNRKGEVLVQPAYDDADASSMDGVICVKLNDKYGIINEEGKRLCDIKYDAIGRFSYKCSLVAIGNSLGVINNAGIEIIPVQFEKIKIINENVIATYQQGAEKLYYHKDGNIVDEKDR